MHTENINYCEIKWWPWRPEILARQQNRRDFDAEWDERRYVYLNYSTAEKCEICFDCSSTWKRERLHQIYVESIRICKNCINLVCLVPSAPFEYNIPANQKLYKFDKVAITVVNSRAKLYWRHNLFARDLGDGFMQHRRRFLLLWWPVLCKLARELTYDVARITIIIMMEL